MLNSNSPVPLYLQLADLILSWIEKGQIKTGERLPSENELSAKYKIGRPTVRQALDVLIRKGVIEKKKGLGTYVKEKVKSIDLFSLAGTSAAFQKEGINIKHEIIRELKIITVPEQIDNPFIGQNAYYFERLSKDEKSPILIELFYLDPQIFSNLERYNLENASLSHIVEKEYYMKPTGGRQFFGVAILKGKMAFQLKLPPGSPILHIKRFLHFSKKENAIYSEIFCRTDRFVFSQELVCNL